MTTLERELAKIEERLSAKTAKPVRFLIIDADGTCSISGSDTKYDTAEQAKAANPHFDFWIFQVVF